MARLPQPGGDTGTWGAVLNEYLSVAHTATGELKPGSVSADSLADGIISEAKLTSAVQSKLNAAASVTSVSGKTGDVTLTKADVGLGSVDNTSDANKPVSIAAQTALNAKADTSSLAAVATSGSYGDLTNKPTIPVIVTAPTPPSNPNVGDLWIDLSE